MAEPTEADRNRAFEVVRQATADEKWLPRQPYPLVVYRFAQALADERERARAPFLALADKWHGLDPARAHAAVMIRRAAEETGQ